MSTRGITGFRSDGRDKLIYNHADSQPDGLGRKILEELRGVKNWNTALDRIESLATVPEQQRLNKYTGIAEAEIRRAYPDLKYQGGMQNIYDLYQPLQGTLAPYLDGKLSFSPEASDFIHNSLFCEWGYVANLDTEKYEIWKGLQTKPDPDNRYGTEPDRMGYYPCTLIKEYDLNNLPTPGQYLSDYNLYKDISSSRQ